MRRLIALLFLLGVSQIHAEPLRVTTWNLNLSPQAPAAATDEKRLANIASVLNSLEADVILLQEVPDRRTCERLAALLKPSRYQTATCSAFTDLSGHDLPQVAVLTRKPVAAAWTEPWKPEGLIAPPGGLAFAAIRHDTGLVIVYSVQLRNNATSGDFERDTQINILKRELSAAQLLQHARSIEARLTSLAAAIIIAGSLNTNPEESQFVSENTLRLLEQAGFKSAFDGGPLENRVTRRGTGQYAAATLDYVFAKRANFLGNPNILASKLSGHLPITCDLVVKLTASVPQTPSVNPLIIHWWMPTLTLAALLLFSVGWWFASRKKFFSPTPVADSNPRGLLSSPAEGKNQLAALEFPEEKGATVSNLEQDTATSPAQSQIQSLKKRALAAEQRAERASELVRKGMIPHLARLMKDTLFYGVASQRAHLLKMQQAGAAQVAELEQRLVKIQSQLQGRLTAYERRIAELEKEVSNKDQANRELLAARIQMVKQTLEAVKSQAPVES
ncbi:MAG: hypothetical protein DME21_06440 [Verrucomicrobia bacterium]|nr:MAG: hypothetical protein DME21_06440 [Verrucomicrobiota bacterium]